jgi:hypothetical protein
MKTSIVLVLTLVFLSCNNQKNKEYIVANVIQEQAQQNHPGKKLMEINCYVCHSPSVSHDDRIGPPMIAIKKHYLNDETTKGEFIAEMQAWVKNPNADKAKMYGAVKRFGVMPKQTFSEETIYQIADYIFDNEIEQPEWFEEHFKDRKGTRQSKGEVKQNK